MKHFSKSITPQSCAGFVLIFSVAILGFSKTPLAEGNAQEGHGSNHRSVSSHEHGAAQLGLAVEGTSLHVNFISPAANIVGFERLAESLEENEAVAAAVVGLNNPSILFSFEGTTCEVSEVSVHAEGVLPEETDAQEGSNDGDHEGHAEFEATYVFVCNNTADLTGMSIKFFDVWPGIEEIETVYLGATRTKLFELTARSNHLDLN